VARARDRAVTRGRHRDEGGGGDKEGVRSEGSAPLHDVPSPDVSGSAAGDRHKWWVFVAVSFGIFMVLMDSTIVNIAVPTLMTDLHTTVVGVSWVLNAYNLALAVLFLAMGRFADRYGQKVVFLLGLAVFTALSLASGLSPSVSWMIGFRVAQAVGGAAMLPVSLAILLTVFPRRQHGFATALWGAVGGVAAALGPTLGGLIVEYVSWRWIFFVNVPIGLVGLLLGLRVLSERRTAGGAVGTDVAGIVLSAAGLFALTLALIQGGAWGWTSLLIISLFVGASLALAVFLVWELRSSSPLLNPRLFRVRPFAAADLAILAIGVSTTGSVFLLVIHLVTVAGFSELKAGMLLTPMSATGLVVGPFVGRLIDRVGPRWLAAIGAVFFAIGFFSLAGLRVHPGAASIIWPLIVIGFGIGFTFPSLFSSGMSSLPPQTGGVGSGTLTTARQLGFVLGVAILVALFSHTVTTHLVTARRQASAIVASSRLPAATRSRMLGRLHRAGAADLRGGGLGAGQLTARLGRQPVHARSGAPRLRSHVRAIFLRQLDQAFRLPFYAAAGAALAAVVPGLLTGTKLGEERHKALAILEEAQRPEEEEGAA
jgi:EmrB/QacA subfamily drug resistance transporter